MAIVLALEKLFNDVSARFVTETTAAKNLFGWREPAKQLPTGVTGSTPNARICWVPGDDESGGVGDLGPARGPGGNPRSLGTLGEVFTVYLIASDPTQPENEFAQYKAARLLFDAWWRAVYLSAHGTLQLTKPKLRWANEKLERRHGAAIRVLLSVDAMIPDIAYPDAAVDDDLEADAAVTELDVTETASTDQE
jgi:hypothetical protein